LCRRDVVWKLFDDIGFIIFAASGGGGFAEYPSENATILPGAEENRHPAGQTDDSGCVPATCKKNLLSMKVPASLAKPTATETRTGVEP
jgi:hypothetical protein